MAHRTQTVDRTLADRRAGRLRKPKSAIRGKVTLKINKFASRKLAAANRAVPSAKDRARAAAVNKGKQGLLKRSVDRTLQLRTGKGEPKTLLSALQRGKRKGRNKVASSMSRRPAKGTVDRILQLRRAKQKRLGQIGITRTR